MTARRFRAVAAATFLLALITSAAILAAAGCSRRGGETPGATGPDRGDRSESHPRSGSSPSRGRTGAEPDGTARKVAFLVGVSKYDHGFDNLQFAERDVEELGKVLKAGGFEVVVLTGSAAGADRATRKNVLARLQALLDGDGNEARGIKKGDLVLVALSGHGQQIFVPDPADPKARRDDSFFCPADGKPNKPETLVSISHLVDDLLAPCGSRNLLLIDACRDIADPNKGKGVEGRDMALKGETAVLFSCARGERSYENADLRHGLFTNAVLKALKGTGTGAGVVTWSSLTLAVEEEMDGEAFRKLLPSGATQTPVPTRGQLPRTVLMAAAKAAPKSDPPVGEAGRDVSASEKVEEFEHVVEGEKRSGRRRVLTVDVGGGQTMEFVRIPKGTFTMGSPAGEKGQGDDEARHDVEVARDFYLGKYEVTQGQYRAVAGASPSRFDGDRRPVERVSWDDAAAFCEALGKKLGRAVVLPSEAQWEYACRAGTATPFHFGSKLNGDLANCDGNNPYGTEEKGAYRKVTAEVGSYPANPWGLYDLHGNVWEWCRDYYGPYGKVAGGKDPVQLTKQSENSRVLRGSSWNDYAGHCRAANRFRSAPDSRNDVIGFRVCLPLD
jgi:formylglycine-generating enzyme required for sulfatase activity